MKRTIRHAIKKVIAGLLIVVMSTSPVLSNSAFGSIQVKAESTMSTQIDLNQELSKDEWRQSTTDNKWRKIVDIPELMLDKESVGTKKTLAVESTKPMNAWSEGNKSDTTVEVKETNGKRGLQLEVNTAAGPSNVYYGFNFADVEADWIEIRMAGTNNQLSKATEISANTLTMQTQTIYPIGEDGKVGQKGNLKFLSTSFNSGITLQKVNGMFFKIWTGGAKQSIFFEKLQVVAVSDTKPEPPKPVRVPEPVGENEWKQGSDLKWRKYIAKDFANELSVGVNDNIEAVSPDKAPVGEWRNKDAASSPTNIVLAEKDGKKELTFTRPNPIKGPSTLYWRLPIEGSGASGFEIRIQGTKQVSNWQNYQVRRDLGTALTSGRVINADTGAVIVDDKPEYSMTSNGPFNYEITFDGTSNDMQFIVNHGPIQNEVTFTKMEFIAVSEYNPEAASPKSLLIQEKDVILPKNSGGFENWGTAAITQNFAAPLQAISPAALQISSILPVSEGAYSFAMPFSPITIPATGNGDILVRGNVTIVEGGKYKDNHSAQITAGSELSVKIERLLPNTEYTIFFAANPSLDAKLNFRLSGYKNKLKYTYDDGNYNNGDGGKTWSADERANMLNWVQNLGIGSTGGWADFRYDFTTGADTPSGVLARFEALNGTVNIDEIYVVKRSDINELTAANALPPNTEVSRGNRILIDLGLQLPTWFPSAGTSATNSSVASLSDIEEMGFSALQYNDIPSYNKELHDAAKKAGNPLKWSTAAGPKGTHVSIGAQDGRDGRAGTPTEAEWNNGYLEEKNGLNDLANLVSICMGDEEDYSDTLIQNCKSWFELIRKHYDNAPGRTNKILLHHNEVGNSPQGNLRAISTFNEDMLRKYVQTAKPDMITYDMYYFRERRVEQTVGGTVRGFYDDLNRYRKISSEGLDGTGQQPIPFGQYNYAWRVGPGGGSLFKRGDGWYEMTESQVNLNTFATWAFGGKWMSNFRWVDNSSSYLFSNDTPDINGKYGRYKVFDWFKEMIRQSENLSPHLTRLQIDNAAIIRGQNKSSLTGEIAANGKPADNPDWSGIKGTPMNQNVFIDNVQVKNPGTQNSGLNGDVFVSYFHQLPNLTEADKKVFTSTDPRYFMILNGLTGGDGLPVELQQGSCYETRQQVTITFKNVPAGAKLKKVSRVDQNNAGAVIDVALKNGNQLVTTIGGGLADLYYWECGTQNPDTTTVTADETGLEHLIMGDEKYATTLSKKDMGGKTIVVGNIKGFEDMEPKSNFAKGINKPTDPALQGLGIVLNLDDGEKAMGNITGLSSRYFKLDIWEFRTAAAAKDYNIDLQFKEYDWTKEQVIENVKRVKAGQTVEGMPDILIVPNDWLWEENNLVSNNAVIPLNNAGSQVIDLTAEKWNAVYKGMSTVDGKTYATTTKLSEDPIGLVVNKDLLTKDKVGTELMNAGKTGIYDLQLADKWTMAEMSQIIAKAKTTGVKLFVDNEYLIRQLMVTFGVDASNPYTFDAASPEYAEMMTFYNDLKTSGLLLEKKASIDEELAAFYNKEVVFMVAPYTEVAKHLTASFQYYQDNIIRTTGPVQGWGIQTYGAPAPGVLNKDGKDAYTATLIEHPAGKYAMGDKWNFMLFPKKDTASNYKAILNNPSYPVILSTTKNVADTATVLNRLDNQFRGTNQFEVGRDVEKYPLGRTDPGLIANLNSSTARDNNTINKIAARDGYGDNIKASGMFDEVLSKAVTSNTDAATVNVQVKEFLKKLGVEDDTPIPEEKPGAGNGADGGNGGAIPGGGAISGGGGGAPTVPEVPDNTETPSKPEDITYTLGSEKEVEKLVTAVESAETKSEIAIQAGDDSVLLPKDVLSAAKGKDVTLKVVQNSVTCYINGKAIGTLSSAVDAYDIKINIINEKALSKAAKGKDIVQFELAYQGKLPFEMEISKSVGKKQKGKMLYYNYYDTAKKRMVYSSVSGVDKNGTLRGKIKNGGKYVISSTPGYVAKPIKSISGATNQILGKNNKVQLKVKISPSTYTVKPVQWKVSNSKYAAVDANGVVKAKKEGLGKTIKVSANALDGTGKKKVFKVQLTQKK